MGNGNVEIKKLDYLLELDLPSLKRQLDLTGFDEHYARDILMRLQDIRLILGKSRGELNPEERKVYDKFKKDEIILDQLFSRLDNSMFAAESAPTTDKSLRAVPVQRPKPFSINIVQIGEGVFSIGTIDRLVSVHVWSSFTPAGLSPTVAYDAAKDGLIAYGWALALYDNPYASKSAKSKAAKDLGKALEKMNPPQLEPIKDIVAKLKKGNLSALEELNASGTEIVTQMGKALKDSKVLFYDGYAVVELSADATFVWETPKSRAFKEFLAGVKEPSLAVIDIFLALKASTLGVGATRFKATESGGVKAVRSIEPGYLASAAPGFSLGTGLFGVPTVISLSAEFGYVQYGEGKAAQKKFYVGVQSITMSFQGKESERFPVRISSAGVSHTGTVAKENYLAYLTLSAPLRRSATFDIEVNVAPYVSNFFDLIYGGAKPEVALKLFPTTKKTNFWVEGSAGADLWIGEDNRFTNKMGINPELGAGLVWGPVSFKLFGSYDTKYEEAGRLTGRAALEIRF